MANIVKSEIDNDLYFLFRENQEVKITLVGSQVILPKYFRMTSYEKHELETLVGKKLNFAL